jgi:ATP-dependent Clp protease protease subunit
MAEKKSVYFIFSALIDQLAVQRFFALTAGAMQDGIEEIHLLMQSVGGNVGDGVCLYNFFRALPIEVSIYNCGHISSAGVTAYLGGDRRYVTAQSTFMIHRATAVFQGANSDAVQARIPSLIMDDERTEAILKAHVELTPEQWEIHKSADLWVNSTQAVAAKLSSGVNEFDVPPGARLFNVFP